MERSLDILTFDFVSLTLIDLGDVQKRVCLNWIYESEVFTDLYFIQRHVETNKDFVNMNLEVAFYLFPFLV